MRTAPPAPCWALSVTTEPAQATTIAMSDAHTHNARFIRMVPLLSSLATVDRVATGSYRKSR
jgi:hypothetical protein